MSYSVAPHVHHRSLDGEVVILDGRGDNYLGLNRTGALIWDTIVQGGSAADAAAVLTQQFEISREIAAADVETFLGRLVASGILQPDNA